MYTVEESTLILIALMKAHGVRRVIASPGMRNMPLVVSLQRDPDFEVFSSVDERSAAYMACGMAAQTGEPVALSCTGATASRNYMPGLTEAFYRKLPVIAITSTYHQGELYQLKAQSIDRMAQPNDIVRASVQVPMIRCKKDREMVNLRINHALLELRRNGGGPVHINLETLCSRELTVTVLPQVRVIQRHTFFDGEIPPIPEGRVGIYVGAHLKWDERLTGAVDAFCLRWGAVVFCSHTSNYHGRYRIDPSLVSAQEGWRSSLRNVELLVHMGEVSGAPFMGITPKVVWRVSPDGELRDTFGKLQHVFEMDESTFFSLYAGVEGVPRESDYLARWQEECEQVRALLPDLPLSNGWLAQQVLGRIPEGSTLHLGIYNSLRMWNFFNEPEDITCSANTGGFGIDGIASTLLGAALTDSESLFFAVLGDLAFFYDMNALGNRHVPNNMRILLVNNGLGAEFRNYRHPAEEALGEEANPFVAAEGHFGNKSRDVVRHYATDMGFEYLSADNKDEFLSLVERFVDSNIGQRPMLLEVFTTPEDERAALRMVRSLRQTTKGAAKRKAKEILGQRGMQAMKKVMGR